MDGEGEGRYGEGGGEHEKGEEGNEEGGEGNEEADYWDEDGKHGDCSTGSLRDKRVWHTGNGQLLRAEKGGIGREAWRREFRTWGWGE
jgi:hypothetical protein